MNGHGAPEPPLAPLDSRRLTSGTLLAKNTVWNLVGQGVPILTAVFAIPLLIQGLGIDRFGILTLAWMVIGYFGLFDFGIGRALTKVVAEKLGANRPQEIPEIAWTGLFLMLLLGLAGTAAAAALTPWLVYSTLKVPAFLQQETITALYLLALSIPIVISTVALRGLLEAYQRFDLLNAMRIPMGLFMFFGPLLVLPFSRSLPAVVAVLMAGRVAAWAAHLYFCLRQVPELKAGITVRRVLLRPLFRFGAWMTVSNLIGPLMVYLDRFLIGAVVSMAAVAYYTTPYEMVTKLGILPSSLVGVLFPAFASSLVQNRDKALILFQRGTNYIYLSLFPIALVLVVFAPEGLELWLGPEFARQSAAVLRWLAAGVLVNCLAQVPFALIQGAGRPDLTAKLHAVELPLYLAALWFLLARFGIAGVAMAWFLRAFVDMIALFLLAHRLAPCREFLGRSSAYLTAALLSLLLGAALSGAGWKALYVGLLLAAFAGVAWSALLQPEERAFFRGCFRPGPKP